MRKGQAAFSGEATNPTKGSRTKQRGAGRPPKTFVETKIGNLNFAQTWDELARILTQRLGVSVTRKSLQDWRNPRLHPDLENKWPRDRADGRKDVVAWMRFMLETGRNRADETLEADELGPSRTGGDDRTTVRDWKIYREELACQEAERRIARSDNLLLVATELELPVGAMLAAINSKLSLYPPRAARFMVMKRDVADAELTLRDEMDAVIKDLNLAEYIDPPIEEILAEFPFDEQSATLYAKVSFVGQDRAAFIDLIRRTVEEALRRIGRRALAVGSAPEGRDDSIVESNEPDTIARTDQTQSASAPRNEPQIAKPRRKARTVTPASKRARRSEETTG